MSLPPLTVIGGYLGAGKTTLVNRLLSEAQGERVAVIVNDFGAINVDADLISSRDEDTVRLTNGCMCCTASDGTASALSRLVARAGEIDRIVIETSGVAEPGKVALNAHGFQLPLDGVIVLSDAELLPTQAANRYMGDVVRRQLAQADLILLNKSDLVETPALGAVRSLIRSVAPGRPIITTNRADMPTALLFGARSGNEREWHPEQNGAKAHGHESRYRTWLVEKGAPMTRPEVEAMVEDLTSSAVRAKGSVQLADDPEVRHVYQQVGRRWTLVADGSWGKLRARTQVVAIALAVAEA